MKSGLPFGYWFNPTDGEIILFYLRNRILGLPLPADFFPTIDFYPKSPDQLPLCDFKYQAANEWYFFTTRPNGNFLTDNGYYSISMDEEVYSDNEVVGSVQTLAFYEGKPPNGKKTNWIIHEFRVSPDIAIELDASTREKISNFVAWRIIRTDLGRSPKAGIEPKFLTDELKELLQEK